MLHEPLGKDKVNPMSLAREGESTPDSQYNSQWHIKFIRLKIMRIHPFTLTTLAESLAEGWQMTRATLRPSVGYSLVFTFIGLLGLVLLNAFGFLPFMLAMAGSFMIFGPVMLAGFYGIARAREAGEAPGFGAILDGFRQAAPSFWVLALVCLLLFLIFVTDAAILYSYMVGDLPLSFESILENGPKALRFLFWAKVSGAFIAGMVYVVTAFSVPLLCERKAELVPAVVTSIRATFGNAVAALAWALLLGSLGIAASIFLPALPLVLPWLAYSGRALARRVVAQ